MVTNQEIYTTRNCASKKNMTWVVSKTCFSLDDELTKWDSRSSDWRVVSDSVGSSESPVPVPRSCLSCLCVLCDIFPMPFRFFGSVFAQEITVGTNQHGPNRHNVSRTVRLIVHRKSFCWGAERRWAVFCKEESPPHLLHLLTLSSGNPPDLFCPSARPPGCL